MHAIEAVGLEKTYGKGWRRAGQVALAGVDLHVPVGSAFGLIGPNGAGKTTFIKSVLGIVRPTGGEARVLGGKSLGGALALTRMRARSQGQEDLAKLLDFARVRPDGDAFRLEVALPLDVLKERLAFCREPVPEAAAGDGGVERL